MRGKVGGLLLAAGSAIAVGAAAPAWADGATQQASVGPRGAPGNGQSDRTAISADGRFVAFPSVASNLGPGDTNDTRDVFVRDRRSETTRRESVALFPAPPILCGGV